ncbi:biopolymer transporter ExbD [candidate division KSB1 bacterium]|nr:biopolymer transporter ExbD [candidate division KSB1 bacterium]
MKMKMNKSPQQQRGLTEINLTSLIDVSLTLVIIFMVSYPMVMQSAISVSSPAMKQATSDNEASDIKAEINLTAEQHIELNGAVIAESQFADSLQTLLTASRDKIVIISADGSVLHDKVVAMLDMAKQCGAKQLSIIRRK